MAFPALPAHRDDLFARVQVPLDDDLNARNSRFEWNLEVVLDRREPTCDLFRFAVGVDCGYSTISASLRLPILMPSGRDDLVTVRTDAT